MLNKSIGKSNVRVNFHALQWRRGDSVNWWGETFILIICLFCDITCLQFIFGDPVEFPNWINMIKERGRNYEHWWMFHCRYKVKVMRLSFLIFCKFSKQIIWIWFAYSGMTDMLHMLTSFSYSGNGGNLSYANGDEVLRKLRIWVEIYFFSFQQMWKKSYVSILY